MEMKTICLHSQALIKLLEKCGLNKEPDNLEEMSGYEVVRSSPCSTVWRKIQKERRFDEKTSLDYLKRKSQISLFIFI